MSSEPTPMEYMLHNTRDHRFPGILDNKELKLHHALYELSDDDVLLMRYADRFREEVLRLREELSRLYKWEDNVREYFGDEAMMDFYEIYGGEEE